MGRQRLKHVYSGITVTSDDLAAIVERWRAVAPPQIRANRSLLDGVDDLHAVVAEDAALDAVSLQAVHGDRWLAFTWQPGYVLIEASEADARLVRAFTAAAELLAAKPKNGFGQCCFELTPPGARRPARPAAEGAWSRVGQWFAAWFGRARTA